MKNLPAVLITVLGGIMLLAAIRTVITGLSQALNDGSRAPGYFVGWCLGFALFAVGGSLLIYWGVKRIKRNRSRNR